jgi:pyrrolidone-carboxylate peptidase
LEEYEKGGGAYDERIKMVGTPHDKFSIDTSMKIIVTGFGPFLSHKTNPSQDVGQKSVASLQEKGVEAEFMPLVASYKAIDAFYSSLSPADVFVLHIGLDASRSSVCVETSAKNISNCISEDATGYIPSSRTPFPTLPPAAIIRNKIDFSALVPADPLICLSDDAGDYVCNYAYGTALLHVGVKIKGAAFIHIPCLSEMPLELISRKVTAVALSIMSHSELFS